MGGAQRYPSYGLRSFSQHHIFRRDQAAAGDQDRSDGDRRGRPRKAGEDAGGRSRSTAIYFLLARGERSHWHRIDAVEVWHYYAGSALTLRIADGTGQRSVKLGADLAAGEAPQAIVPPHAWQAAESNGDWTLVGCTVAPGFEFSKFELAPKDWEPS